MPEGSGRGCSDIASEGGRVNIFKFNIYWGFKKSEYILREKSLAIYFEDSQLKRNRTFNILVSKIYVDKRLRVR